MNSKFVIASSPHIGSALSTQKIMAWVLLALLPAGVAGAYFFGTQVLYVVATCVIACVISEFLWQKALSMPVTVSDLSAVVTGVLLAYNLPPSIPLWMAAMGSVFAIIICKQFFGGLGGNIVNPALAGRAMMLISWPVAMTAWTINGISGATPLAIMKLGNVADMPPMWNMFIGNIGGCIGETSVPALLLGGALLIWKDIISWRIPVIFIAVVAAMSFLLGRQPCPSCEVMVGGLMLGAFFMATDYTTSPITVRGQIIFAAGCGLLTSLIRTFGSYPEGVSFAILIMNIVVPLIDMVTEPRILGEVKK